ncbi:hypothetical protein ASPVEDRAFT_485005 [Aspergillus versicolor CBS 583.65]|uniref:Uncharacterized protein n=1 Tax=Aspergillus versicolor CBS 583.65 TaxID=1036611 RepID=A0A1L9PBD2_ASPVE|nr:uncharacterized protein ASPVEDRAFT_485005 [Aspergillus versicolor CBS 583.65]OJI98837.1 hypothetical protein ASPVEDRAFT_485005 [Aspergillus versicolor CBS 583.65]
MWPALAVATPMPVRNGASCPNRGSLMVEAPRRRSIISRAHVNGHPKLGLLPLTGVSPNLCLLFKLRNTFPRNSPLLFLPCVSPLCSIQSLLELLSPASGLSFSYNCHSGSFF